MKSLDAPAITRLDALENVVALVDALIEAVQEHELQANVAAFEELDRRRTALLAWGSGALEHVRRAEQERDEAMQRLAELRQILFGPDRREPEPDLGPKRVPSDG